MLNDPLAAGYKQNQEILKLVLFENWALEIKIHSFDFVVALNVASQIKELALQRFNYWLSVDYNSFLKVKDILAFELS